MAPEQDILDAVGRAIARGYEVFAPVNRDGLVLLAPVERPEDIHWGHLLTTNNTKDVFLPRHESLVAYDLDKMEVSAAGGRTKMIVVVGTRPCDAAALSILDAIFMPSASDAPKPTVDSRYADRRDRSVVVTLACTRPDGACFCASMGYGPHDPTGSDVMLMPCAGGLLARPETARGKAFMDEVGMVAGAGDPAAAPVLTRKVDAADLKRWLDQNFDDPVWQGVSANCVSCGACAYLCPTCHCFDITDEAGLSRGERLRIWDSCSFSNFTRMASHQPRAGRAARYRQRVMHKFSYCPANIGKVACVGDGRCIRHCAFGVDICEVIERLVSEERLP